MANFSISKEYTKDLEGGFWNDPTAGWTYAGITKKFYPNWPGFALLAKLQQTVFKGKPIPRYTVFKNDQLNQAVSDFYKNNHWKKINGSYIANQTIANFMYDFFVHKEAAAITTFNNAAKAIQPDTETEKGKVGIRVVELINKYPVEFYNAIRTGRTNFYNSGKFSKALAKSFVDRVNKFPKTV